MSLPNVKTIKLQGRDYAQVNERVKAFHAQYKNGSITTEPNLTGEVAFVKAIVIPDVANPLRVYSASSYGTTRGLKAFEKLETVAVGRALAYLGFSIDGSIASAEEMEEFIERQKETITVPATVKTPNSTQLKRLHTIIASAATSSSADPNKVREWIKNRCEVESTSDLTIDQYDQITQILLQRIETNKAKNEPI